MANYKPVPKVKSGFIAGFLIYALTLVLEYVGIEITPAIANALPWLTGFIVAYLTRDVEREELFHRVESYIARMKELGETRELK